MNPASLSKTAPTKKSAYRTQPTAPHGGGADDVPRWLSSEERANRNHPTAPHGSGADDVPRWLSSEERATGFPAQSPKERHPLSSRGGAVVGAVQQSERFNSQSGDSISEVINSRISADRRPGLFSTAGFSPRCTTAEPQRKRVSPTAAPARDFLPLMRPTVFSEFWTDPAEAPRRGRPSKPAPSLPTSLPEASPRPCTDPAEVPSPQA
jgi:hypothetical protein